MQVFHENEREVFKRSQLVSNREKNDLILIYLTLVQ